MLAGEGASGGEKTGVHAATVIKKVAYGYLQLLALSGGGGGFVVDGGGLWCGEAVARGDVDGRSRAGANALGAQAGKEGIDVSGVG